jgi:hypothetical protein
VFEAIETISSTGSQYLLPICCPHRTAKSPRFSPCAMISNLPDLPVVIRPFLSASRTVVRNSVAVTTCHNERFARFNSAAFLALPRGRLVDHFKNPSPRSRSMTMIRAAVLAAPLPLALAYFSSACLCSGSNRSMTRAESGSSVGGRPRPRFGDFVELAIGAFYTQEGIFRQARNLCKSA